MDSIFLQIDFKMHRINNHDFCIFRNNLRCNCWTAISWIDNRWAWTFATSSIYAIPYQWPIYHGRFGKQLSIHSRWPWIHHYGSNTCTWKTEIKSNPINSNGFHFYSRLIFHHMAFYAHEIAGLFATIEIKFQEIILTFRFLHKKIIQM